MSDWDARRAPASAADTADATGATHDPDGLDGAVGGPVGAAMAGIADLDGVPLAEHVARFDSVHRTLADALSAIDGN